MIKVYMQAHMTAFFLGFLLDLVLGDPYCFPHPIRLIGKVITGVEKRVRRSYVGYAEKKNGTGVGDIPVSRIICRQIPVISTKLANYLANKYTREYSRKGLDRNRAEFLQGVGLVLIVLGSVSAAVLFLLGTSYRLHLYLGMAVECIMTYQILAVKCLKVESMKVWQCLKNNHLEQARAAVSMIVGRDTECLDEEGVARAAIETVAENTSDGVAAPMLYLAVGGPVLGFLYKAVNTMDSMVGYKNEQYLYFGRAAAKLDDAVNFLPARISAGFMIVASFLAGRDFSGKGALAIYRRDRRKHASPNSGHTEAVCAGALGIRLAGDASYFGKMVKKPYIGDALRQVEYEDIRRANGLMMVTAWLCETFCLLMMWILAV